MARQVHRVKRGPRKPAVPMPKDTWKGRTFVEAETGYEFEVVYSGRHMPCVDLPRDSWGRWTTVGHPVIGAPSWL